MTGIGKTAHDIQSSACLSCGRVLDAASGADHDHRPTSGDITVCLRCGHIMAFADDLSLRDLTDGEMVAVAGDERILAVQRAREIVGVKP